MTDSPLQIAGRQFTSRLMVGTGKFSSNESMKEALEASGSQIVTVALRRADLTGSHDPAANILDFIDPEKYLILPNTSGATTAEEAVRLARLAAAAGLPNWIKLEIHPDAQYLMFPAPTTAPFMWTAMRISAPETPPSAELSATATTSDPAQA